MIEKVYGKDIILICDCIDCNNMAKWRQSFETKKGNIAINLCEQHHYILRTKIPRNFSFDENVLKWLMVQGTNPYKVAEYGTLHSLKNVLMMEQLRNIELEFE
jgi:hypothetical protein